MVSSQAVLQNLDTYLIHYSKLTIRFDLHRSSFTWDLLQPSVVTEKCIDTTCLPKSSDYIPNSSIRVSMFGNISSIYHILDYHAYCASKGLFRISPAIYSFADHIVTKSSKLKLHFLAALKSYSRKNQELSFQHLHAIRCFIDSGKNFGLFLEDDSFHIDQDQDSFTRQLDEILTDMLLIDCGYCDISNSFNWTPKVAAKSKNSIFRMADGQTRCCSSYLLTRKAAMKIASCSEYPYLPIDWHLSYLLHCLRIPTFWAVNPLFVQGSQAGICPSNQSERGSC